MYIYVYTYIHIHTHIYIYICMCVCVYVCVCVCVCVCIFVYICFLTFAMFCLGDLTHQWLEEKTFSFLPEFDVTVVLGVSRAFGGTL
jgi:hypothetical protein